MAIGKGKKKAMKKRKTPPRAEMYKHPEAESPMRPDVRTHPQLKKKPPSTYSYDSSLSPPLGWEGQCPTRRDGQVPILIRLQVYHGWAFGNRVFVREPATLPELVLGL